MELDFKIIATPVGSYQANCYVIYNKEKEAIIIDPGAEGENIIDMINERGFKVSKILLTHAHPDHFGAMRKVRDAFDVPVYLSEDDEELLETRSKDICKQLGIELESLKADILFKDEDEISFGDKNIKVILTPGHTPGGACFLLDNVLFSGDTLFKGSIGRTDLPGGDTDTIFKSLKKLMELPNDTIVLPGHGPQTNIQFEKMVNPFVRRLV